MKFAWPFVSRKELNRLDLRLKDVERHFVTARAKDGTPAQTLADVPLEERKTLKAPQQRGLTWQQRKALLEATNHASSLAVSSEQPEENQDEEEMYGHGV